MSALVVTTSEIVASVIYILLIVDGVKQIRSVWAWRSFCLEANAEKLISALATFILVVIVVSITHIANGAISPVHVKLLMTLAQLEPVTILALDALASTTQIALLAKRLTTANGALTMEIVQKLERPGVA
jgi:hypothetical protein